MRIAFSDEAFDQLQSLTPEQRTSVANLIRAIQDNPKAGWFYYKNKQGDVYRIAPGLHVDLIYLVAWEVREGTIYIAAIIEFPFPSYTDYEDRTRP